MMNLTINKELNGIELSFDSKPAAATLEALKSAGFRWHNVKKLWYAKQTPERLTLAQSIAGEPISTGKTTAPKKSDKINLDNLGQNAPNLWGAELAAAIREDLKKRGVTGVTVRSRKVTHDTGITVTIKATAEDIASIEELKERYPFHKYEFEAGYGRGIYDGERWIYPSTWETMTDEEKQESYNNYVKYSLCRVCEFSTHYHERKDCPELASAFYEKCNAVFMIANQWNWDRSDSMTDYFDIGYFLDIEIKKPADFQPRENMTDEEREQYADVLKKEEEERAAAIAKREQERKEAEETRKRYEDQRNADRAEILKDINVKDIEPIYITNLVGGCGKESTLKELEETLAECSHKSDAIITRKVVFSSPAVFEKFGNYLIDDWDFLTGKGGTGSSDKRLETVENLYKLNEEQRESVKWYMVDCVGVYVGEELILVSNPEGYTYSRYTYKPTKESTTTSAAEEEDKQEKATENLPPFYFPAPVEEQAKAICTGQKITVYQCDGWNLASIYGGSGTVLNVKPGTWAQYKGVYIAFANGKQIFIRDGKKCLIYDGIKPLLPDSVTREKIRDNMYQLFTVDGLLKNTYKYYFDRGETPIIDTCQR